MNFRVYLVLATCSCWPIFGLPPGQVEFFENRIRPVLAESCYECHNSVNKSEAGLALDYRDALLAGSDEGAVIVAGKPEESVMIWAIRHQDGFEMPDNGPKLEDAVIADFEEWVRMGAPDPRLRKPTQLDLDNAVPWPELLERRRQWWSFQPLKRTHPPQLSDREWNRNPIDRFIFSALQNQGLVPQDEAPPETLVRRLHLILTGLPPKADVVRAFVEDPSEEAYQALVDKLLDSPAYGERWARHWMDWYRYAESHGSEGDPNLPYASTYRDYIIRALNADVPYDDLLMEHIAGDLLPRPRINRDLQFNESAIGPAHFRMVPYGYGVVDAYQEQINFTENQIDVISKAMLGITVACARCHNHKFDPISQKDFYRFYGIMISHRPGSRNIDIPQKQALHKLTLAGLKPNIRMGMANYWLEHLDSAVEKLAAFSFQETEEDKELIEEFKKAPHRRQKDLPTDPDLLNQFLLKWEMAKAGKYHPFALVKHWINKPAEELAAAWSDQIKSHQKDVEEFEDAKKNATFYADLRDQKTLDSWYQEGNGLGPKVSPAGSFAVAGEGIYAISGIYPRGVYSHLISDKHNGTLSSPYHVAEGDWSFMRAVGLDGAINMSVRNYPLDEGLLHPYETAETGFAQWFPLQKYEFWNGELVHYQISTMGDKPVKHEEERSWFGLTEVIAGEVKMKELGAPLFTVLDDPSIVTDRASLLTAYKGALRESILAWKRSNISDAQAQFLSAFVRFDFLPNKLDALPERLAALISQYRDLESEIPFPTRAPALLKGDVIDQPLLVRGEYKQAAEIVPRQFLEVFSNRTYSKNNSGRLQLAKDIVSPANTLKSRVLVNRLWAYVFGRGIVATTDNLGRLGKKPTHPELLDYLALEIEKKGWSIKSALKQMVSSRAFRSASIASQGSKEKDPDNQYLSYFTPRRLEAEAIMDSVSSMAGDNFQRGVYMKVKRNKLHPFLATFNFPIPTTTVSRRNSTNVPAQALSMMNGEFVQEAGVDWAKIIQERVDDGPIETILEVFFIDAYARRPSQIEKKQLSEYYAGMEDPDAALENIAFALMNTKEFIYVY